MYAGSAGLALHAEFLYNDRQQALRRLIARRYQEDLHNIADLTDELIHEFEWDAPHIRQAGLHLDVTDPRSSMREYSLHMMQPAMNNNTRYGSHLEIRYAEIVLNRRILIIENRRQRVIDGEGRVRWRHLNNEYQGIFLSPGLSAEEMGLTQFQDIGHVFNVLREHNLDNTIVLRLEGLHYRPIYLVEYFTLFKLNKILSVQCPKNMLHKTSCCWICSTTFQKNLGLQNKEELELNYGNVL